MRSAQVIGRSARRMAIAAGAVAAVALGACGSEDPARRDAATTAPSATIPARDAVARVTEKDFDPRNFSDPLRIDNAWSPLEPGMRFVYEGRANRGQGRLPHRVVFTVTDLTKTIDGVRTVVLWDRDFNGGELREGGPALPPPGDQRTIWDIGGNPGGD